MTQQQALKLQRKIAPVMSYLWLTKSMCLKDSDQKKIRRATETIRLCLRRLIRKDYTTRKEVVNMIHLAQMIDRLLRRAMNNRGIPG